MSMSETALKAAQAAHALRECRKRLEKDHSEILDLLLAAQRAGVEYKTKYTDGRVSVVEVEPGAPKEIIDALTAQAEKADRAEYSYRNYARGAAAHADLLATLAEERADLGQLDDLYARYMAVADAEEQRRQRHRNVRKAIADLPHLFIAC
jgi:hypothetical protein